jgi:hypothetical protein
MWKRRLAVISILVVLVVVGFFVGAYAGDATCDPADDFFGGLECYDRSMTLGGLGAVAGLLAGGLVVWLLSRRHRP